MPRGLPSLGDGSALRDGKVKALAKKLAAILEANAFISENPREAAEIFLKIENSKLPVAFVQKMITDPEFSYSPEPRNVMKIYRFMNKVGALRNMPAAWQELFFPEIHNRSGS